MAIVTPVVEHWLEREVAQWVHHERWFRHLIATSRFLINNNGDDDDDDDDDDGGDDDDDDTSNLKINFMFTVTVNDCNCLISTNELSRITSNNLMMYYNTPNFTSIHKLA